MVLQGNIVNTTAQVNNLYGNVLGVQSQIPPLYGNVLVLQSNIVNTTVQVNNLYGNVLGVQSQIPPLYGNVLVLQGNIVNTTTQVNNLYGNISVVQSQIPPLYGNVLVLQTKTTAITYVPTTTTVSSNVSIQGNVITNGQIDASNIAVSGFGAVSNTFSVGDNLGVGNNIVNSGHIFSGGNHSCNTLITENLLVNNTVINGNTQAQINNLYGNVSAVQSQIPPLYGNVLVLQTKTTAITYVPTTTTISSNVSIQGNVTTNGQIDASNIAVSGFGAVSNTFSVGDNLGVGNNIVNSGSIFSGGNHSCNTLITENLLVNNTVINGNTQAQINNIHNIINPLFKPVFNTIDPSGLVLYYPFSISQYFNLSTLHPDGIRVGNMATGSIVYDVSLTGISRLDNNSLVSFHTAQAPTGRHGLVINRTITPPTGGMCISFWFIATSIPSSNFWFLYTVQDTLGFPSGARFFITINPQNKIRLTGLNNADVVSNTTIIVGTRYHIVYNCNVSGSASLYINGSLDIFQASNAPVITTNNSGFNSIARDPAGNGLIGTVDDLRHYINTTLSSSQIATLFSLPPY